MNKFASQFYNTRVCVCVCFRRDNDEYLMKYACIVTKTGKHIHMQHISTYNKLLNIYKQTLDDKVQMLHFLFMFVVFAVA